MIGREFLEQHLQLKIEQEKEQGRDLREATLEPLLVGKDLAKEGLSSRHTPQIDEQREVEGERIEEEKGLLVLGENCQGQIERRIGGDPGSYQEKGQTPVLWGLPSF